jgi:hypothetical protein
MAYSVAAQSITAVTAAAVIGSLAIFLTSAVPEARAEQQTSSVPLQQSLAKGDRLPVLVKGAACSTRGWPHYEQTCQFDLRRSADDVGKVRVVAITRS